VEITCYRNQEVKREPRQLPAATYNIALTLLARSTTGNLFIPIRAMQFLAIMDAEELIFLDGERKCWIDIAWRKFHPQARTSIDEPVEYEAVYYTETAEKLMSRLQAELPRALQELAKKSTVEGPAKVLKFPAPVKSE
jgi:alpha-D-ribose 1-methylphosphonate 5-triphosphate synthase subunit PhnH